MAVTFHTTLSLFLSITARGSGVLEADHSQPHEVCPAEGVQRGALRPARAAHPCLLLVDHRGGKCCCGFMLTETNGYIMTNLICYMFSSWFGHFMLCLRSCHACPTSHVCSFSIPAALCSVNTRLCHAERHLLNVLLVTPSSFGLYMINRYCSCCR